MPTEVLVSLLAVDRHKQMPSYVDRVFFVRAACLQSPPTHQEWSLAEL